MTRGYVEAHVMKYTELVYYDADGVELGRERQMDDWWHDVSDSRDMTDVEMEDWA